MNIWQNGSLYKCMQKPETKTRRKICKIKKQEIRKKNGAIINYTESKSTMMPYIF